MAEPDVAPERVIEPPVLTAALILAGYRQWWERPPTIPRMTGGAS